jgi:hypothetical protein
MKKFNNDYHFQLTGDFQTEQGFVISNPVCKIVTKPESAVNTGKIFNMIQGFKDLASMNGGKAPFIFDVNDVRTADFQVPVTDSPFYMFALGLTDNPEGENAFTSQREFIAWFFGIDLVNVTFAKDITE